MTASPYWNPFEGHQVRGIPIKAYRVGALGLLNWAFCIFITCWFAGCTFNDGKTTQHIGYVRVVEVEGSTSGVASKSVRTIGVRVGGGIGVGYFDEKRITVPLDCRIVIIVQTQAQTDEALRRLNGLQRKELCVAIQP